MTAINIEQLSKQYAGSPSFALDKLTLHVNEGEVYGFLGSNGAGKSTTIRLLLNFIQPSGGKGTIVGKDIVKDSVAIKRHVGYLAGDVALYSKMTGHDFLAFMAALQPTKKETLQKLVERFDVTLDKPISALSKGNRQKVGILQAFMHEPQVLILDEPTSGLDPLMQEAFYQTVIEAKERGAAVFVSSHNLTEVQHMCDRVGIIREGKLITEQTIEELGKKPNSQVFTVTFAHDVPHDLATLPQVQVSDMGKRSAIVTVTGTIAPLLAYLGTQKVQSLVSKQIDLEEEFMQFYGDES